MHLPGTHVLLNLLSDQKCIRSSEIKAMIVEERPDVASNEIADFSRRDQTDYFT